MPQGGATQRGMACSSRRVAQLGQPSHAPDARRTLSSPRGQPRDNEPMTSAITTQWIRVAGSAGDF